VAREETNSESETSDRPVGDRRRRDGRACPGLEDCIPNSIGPGGCNSIAPGGGSSIAPGGGQSIAPGGGRSIAPGGGQSIGPGGGRSIAPDGGLSSNRNWNRGLDPNTLQPAPGAPNLPGGRRKDSGSGNAADPQ
jgi:hypothetical protein